MGTGRLGEAITIIRMEMTVAYTRVFAVEKVGKGWDSSD